MNVLIVTPSRREGAKLAGDKLVSGAGAAAREAVTARLARTPADAVAIVGVCGGLDPSLAAGDLVLATRAVAPAMPEIAADLTLLATIASRLRTAGRRFASAGLLTVERPVASVAEKREIWNAHGTAGVDMETYPIAEAAEQRSLPWFALRAVIDPAGTALPHPLHAWSGQQSDAALLLAFARRPDTWFAGALLALQMRRATDALARSVPLALSAVAALPAPSH